MQRLVDEALNGGNLDLIDDLYNPDQSRGRPPLGRAVPGIVPDVHMDTVELVAEGDILIGRFTCTAAQNVLMESRYQVGRLVSLHSASRAGHEGG